jgi:hypothetical protein
MSGAVMTRTLLRRATIGHLKCGRMRRSFENAVVALRCVSKRTL